MPSLTDVCQKIDHHPFLIFRKIIGYCLDMELIFCCPLERDIKLWKFWNWALWWLVVPFQKCNRATTFGSKSFTFFILLHLGLVNGREIPLSLSKHSTLTFRQTFSRFSRLSLSTEMDEQNLFRTFTNKAFFHKSARHSF